MGIIRICVCKHDANMHGHDDLALCNYFDCDCLGLNVYWSYVISDEKKETKGNDD